jgi:hypothetical protein
MLRNNIYQRAKENGAEFECNCIGIGILEWEELMKGHTRANRKEVVKIALQANVIDKEQAVRELKNQWYNPYNHFKTKTHVIYVHSAIEHFIKIL